MTLNCLISLLTPQGVGFTEVRVNSLHQLAILMPGSVLTYEICQQAQTTSGARVDDAELFNLLTWAVSEIACQCENGPTDHCSH